MEDRLRSKLLQKSAYRIGGQTLRGQFVSGETVSRSFVYINHGKFRIVRPFTRPSESTGPPFTIILRASAQFLRPFFERRREAL